MNPLLYGWFINTVQEKGIMQLHYAWLYAFAILGLKLAEWAFHGPARVYQNITWPFTSAEIFCTNSTTNLTPACAMAPGYPSSTTIIASAKPEALKIFRQWLYVFLHPHQICFTRWWPC